MSCSFADSHAPPCNACSTKIKGPRIICLLCLSEDRKTQVDLCANCVNATPTGTGDFAHYIDHPVAKFRTIVHDWEKRALIRSSREAVQRLNFLFRSLSAADQVTMPGVNTSAFVTVGMTISPIDILDSPAPPSLLCCCCKTALTLPCWFCVSCCESVRTFFFKDYPLECCCRHRTPSCSRFPHLR
jgi:hypothetical protein